MDETGDRREIINSQPEHKKPKSFYRKWGTVAAEKVERFLLPEYMKQIWQRNLHLWEIHDRGDQPTFEEEVGTWVDEIREGNERESPGLKALRGDPDEKPHVSIVIPAHNEERYILQVLQSLSEQQYDKRLEVLIVDNNSDPEDRTALLAKQCGAKVIKYALTEDDDDVKVSRVALARQRGLEAASGDIVISTDGDTIVPHRWITAMTEQLDNNPSIAAVTGGIVHYDRPEHYLIYGKDLASKEIRKFLTVYRNKQGPSRKQKSPTSGANTAFRKQDAIRVHGYDITKYPGEDTSLGFKLSKIGRIAYTDNEETRVRVSPRRFEEIGRVGIVKGLLNYRRIYRSRDRAPIHKR